MLKKDTSENLCEYFLKVTSIGEYCLCEGKCPYNFSFQKDYKELGKACTQSGVIKQNIEKIINQA